MVRQKLEDYLRAALASAQQAGTLPPIATDELGVEKSHIEGSDYSSTLPMRLARAVGAPPGRIAAAIVEAGGASPMLATVSVAGPGFINFVLADAWLAGQVDEILTAGALFGRSTIGAGTRLQVEFVSINPTGPLTVGHGRVAVIGDVLARVLACAGFEVQREYYLNDFGNQVRLLGQSIYSHYARALGLEMPLPPGGYKGDYVREWALEILQHDGRKYVEMAEATALVQFVELGIAKALQTIRRDLDTLGIAFDEWFPESSLHNNGEVQALIVYLREQGFVADREGAVWFAHGNGKQDAENVLVKRTGDPTYLASDIAYHRNKFFTRKFDRVINVMGADHHGHVQRMRAAMDALKVDSERLEFVICQMVHVIVEGVPVKQSKRSGDFEVLSQLMDEIGADATRYFMLTRSADSQMDFDVDLAKKQSDENPVHKIRYAHARIASILRKAAEERIDFRNADLARLNKPEELDLIRTMLDFPETVASAAAGLEPHSLPHFALSLAGKFNSYYHVHRVISGEAGLTRARLRLVSAVKQVLANALELMGISAPEVMARDAEDVAATS